MQEIYGYKEKDVLGLLQFLSKGNYKNLSSAFSQYALLSGKAIGTVRNLYYALARKSREDKEFSKKYLQGKTLCVNSIVAFSKQEEQDLIDKILTLTKNGRSVRSAILELSKGDSKLALRYQNKFRNAVKRCPTLKNSVIASDNENNVNVSLFAMQVKRLIERAFSSISKENQRLSSRIDLLERENKKLTTELLGLTGNQSVKRYFSQKDTGVV